MKPATVTEHRHTGRIKYKVGPAYNIVGLCPHFRLALRSRHQSISET